MQPLRYAYIAVGMLSLGLGFVGATLPVLPTTPFVLLSVFCFGKSSQRLHTWLLSTRFYKRHLENFNAKQGMTAKAKLCILATVTAVMGFSFAVMTVTGVDIFPRVVLAFVWLIHVIYFAFKIKTLH